MDTGSSMDKRYMREGELYKARDGIFIIENYVSNREITIRFIETGFSVTVTANNIRNLRIRDYMRPSHCGVGYIGCKYISGDPFHKLIYGKWSDMITRCYSEKSLKSKPEYKGVTVCKEWHNYKEFNTWYNKQNHFHGYELDKDILSKGKKTYSTTTCALIPRWLNLLISGSGTRKLFPGTYKTKSGYRAMIQIDGINKIIGVYDTEKEASVMYQNAKAKIVHSSLITTDDYIDPRVMNKLLTNCYNTVKEIGTESDHFIKVMWITTQNNLLN